MFGSEQGHIVVSLLIDFTGYIDYETGDTTGDTNFDTTLDTTGNVVTEEVGEVKL